jgi:hypothetical protein
MQWLVGALHHLCKWICGLPLVLAILLASLLSAPLLLRHPFRASGNQGILLHGQTPCSPPPPLLTSSPPSSCPPPGEQGGFKEVVLGEGGTCTYL